MKTTILADYKAKTSTGSRIHIAHNNLPLQVNQMIVWMLNHPELALGMVPRWGELKADQQAFADHIEGSAKTTAPKCDAQRKAKRTQRPAGEATMNSTEQPGPLEVRLSDGLDPSAWLVTWKGGEHSFVQAFASELTAVDKARVMGGTCVPLYDLTAAPVAIMDTRMALGLCAPTEEDFPALEALKGRRVALVDLGSNVGVNPAPPCGVGGSTQG